MKIASGKVVSMHYTLTDDAGDVIDSSRGQDPIEYLHGHGNIIGGLENALEGNEAGDKTVVKLSPSEGYGEYNQNAVFQVPRDKFPAGSDIQVGMRVEGEGPEGTHSFIVLGLSEEEVTLDANHPLAGKNLNFDVEIIEVREATDQELAHGHVHDHGHDH